MRTLPSPTSRSLTAVLHSSSKFTGTITEFTNVSPVGFWEGAMSDVAVDGKSLNLAGRTAILDTVSPSPVWFGSGSLIELGKGDDAHGCSYC